MISLWIVLYLTQQKNAKLIIDLTSELTWVSVAITGTCFSPFHTPSCHTLDVTVEGTPTLGISKDGIWKFPFKVENGSNLSCKDSTLEGTGAGISTCAVENGSNLSCEDSALEGTAAGISTCVVDDVNWGVSNVAQPSFLGMDNSTDFASEVAAEGCWGRSAKKSIDATWGVCVGWVPLKDGAASLSDSWNRSPNADWDGTTVWKRSMDEADAAGALERSKLTDLAGPDVSEFPDPEDWKASEKKSTGPPELSDLKVERLLSLGCNDVVLWGKKTNQFHVQDVGEIHDPLASKIWPKSLWM